MMVAVFGLMSLALAAARFAPLRIAVTCMLLCLAVSAWLFLSDVHNRDYGFGLPWLQVESGDFRPADRA